MGKKVLNQKKMEWECKEHNQEDWSCYEIDGEHWHIKRYNWGGVDTLKEKENPSCVQKRCLNCLCKNKDNPTDEIDVCPVYGKISL